MRAKALPRPTTPIGLVLLALLLGPLFGLLSGCALSSSAPSTPNNRYAIVIGVQDYPGIYDDLSYPDNDANDMATLLSAEGWTVIKRLIATDETMTSNGLPTYTGTQDALVEATNLIGSDTKASLLVYYSGHGSVSGSTAYIIPYDGLTATVMSYVDMGTTYYYQKQDLAKWITPATLTSWMAAVPAKHRLLILDSCDSGGFSLSSSAADLSPADYSAISGSTTDSGAISTALSKLSSLISANLSNYGSPEVQVLAAAGIDESSYDDSSHGNGAFTYYLLQAAASADTDSDGVVTMDEAYNYCKTKIKENWNALYWNGDWPTGEDFLPHISGGTGDVVLYSK